MGESSTNGGVTIAMFVGTGFTGLLAQGSLQRLPVSKIEI
jgi:hypothetical protein